MTGAPITKDGTLPYFRYVVKKKGEVEIGGPGVWDVPHSGYARRKCFERRKGEFPL